MGGLRVMAHLFRRLSASDLRWGWVIVLVRQWLPWFASNLRLRACPNRIVVVGQAGKAQQWVVNRHTHAHAHIQRAHHPPPTLPSAHTQRVDGEHRDRGMAYLCRLGQLVIVALVARSALLLRLVAFNRSAGNHHAPLPHHHRPTHTSHTHTHTHAHAHRGLTAHHRLSRARTHTQGVDGEQRTAGWRTSSDWPSG